MVYIMKDILKKSIFYSFAIALTSQLSINWFTANFKISIAVVILAACGLLMSNFPLIPVTFLSAIGVFSMRMIVYWITHGHWTSPSHYMPEIAFYLCYGLLLHLYIRRFDHLSAAIHEKRNLTLGALILIDYLANFIELLVRLELSSLVLHMQSGIFLAAVMRSCLTWLVMLLFEKYRIFLIKKEHEERYQKLVLLFSKLNGEIVWMKKNTTLIEETMNNSYRLFETLRDSDADPALASSALTTAKDIHEIKKEYLLIMRGISEALEQELENDGMYLEEVLSLLKSSITNLAESQEKTLNLTYEYQKTSTLMEEMRNNSISFAIVLDEYGSTAGLVTLEDLIEEIVGDIKDEFDESETDAIRCIGTDEYEIEGSTKLDDLNDVLGTEIESEDYDSIGGHMIELLDHLPKEGETVKEGNYLYSIKKMDKNRVEIVYLKIERHTSEAEPAEM